MPTIEPARLIALQSNPQNVRNICILAHVDHGKTSLTDSLIATNGIISPKLAGKIRYLDSRPDEQTRGITMESSAISLYFSMMRKVASVPAAAPTTDDTAPPAQQKEEYLINLIDSPGHIDFSSEVSTASRLSDAALVLVDAVEGVCSQTVTVLRQVWIEKLKPLLVINKIDRLITELKMTPAEAYGHIGRVLEGVNAVIGGFFQGERMEEDLLWRERREEKMRDRAERRSSTTSNGLDGQKLDAEIEQQFEERDDEDLYFAPEKNNVIFASAIDGWAFTIRQFAGLYEKKLGIKRSVLEKVLWGDFYLDPKTKRVLGQKHLKGRVLKPMFVQLVFENLWAVYEATVGGPKGKGDGSLLEKITKALSISIPPHILRSRDPKAVLQALVSAWLPLSTAVLVSVIEYLPSPPTAQATRLPEMVRDSPGSSHVDPRVRSAVVGFDTAAKAPVIAYVSKMVAVPESELPLSRKKTGVSLTAEEARDLARKKREEIAKAKAEAGERNGLSSVTAGVENTAIDDEDETLNRTESAEVNDPEHLIGFARLYSGELSVGDEINVLPPKFTPLNPHASPEPTKVTVKALYLLMGRSLEPLSKVPAGSIFGIEGLEGHILKTGTLCSQNEGAINLAGVSMASPPIVRVAIEPVNPMDLGKMIRGLKLLEQSDPCALYEQLGSGEHVVLTAGELHLERCLKDLRERYARCEIQAGEPIVPYREGIVEAEEMEPPKTKDLPRGTVEAVTASKQMTIRLRVHPMPSNVTDFLIKHVGAIRKLYSERAQEQEQQSHGDIEPESAGLDTEAVEIDENGAEGGTFSLEGFKKQLETVFDQSEADREAWRKVVGDITAFGPRRVGPNLFIDTTGKNICNKFFREHHNDPRNNQETRNGEDEQGSETGRDFSEIIAYAFQLATAQSPLCNEPMQGVAVFLEDVSIAAGEETLSRESGRLTGEIITSVRSAIGSGFLDWSPRILLAMYSCIIQATPDVLGRVYQVITRRRGSILSESLLEGTPYFTIESKLPVAESFGFSEEIRKRTSGGAQPMLVFCGFEVLDDVDPFWVPKTEEELEDLGELGDRENVAKRYVDQVRRRKGLLIRGNRGVGRDAEKQKTLKKN
ncbi:MAG: hypothetical protein Q9227_009451 [Pyrenula ochraceoflavens]